MIKLMVKRIKRIRRHLDDWKNDIYGVVQAEHEPDDQALSDLLADIMHFCDGEGHDFDRIVEWARGNYEAERGPGDDIEQDARRMEERA